MLAHERSQVGGLLAAWLTLKFPRIDEKCPKLTTMAAAVFQSHINFRTKPLCAWEEFISPRLFLLNACSAVWRSVKVPLWLTANTAAAAINGTNTATPLENTQRRRVTCFCMSVRDYSHRQLHSVGGATLGRSAPATGSLASKKKLTNSFSVVRSRDSNLLSTLTQRQKITNH